MPLRHIFPQTFGFCFKKKGKQRFNTIQTSRLRKRKMRVYGVDKYMNRHMTRFDHGWIWSCHAFSSYVIVIFVVILASRCWNLLEFFSTHASKDAGSWRSRFVTNPTRLVDTCIGKKHRLVEACFVVIQSDICRAQKQTAMSQEVSNMGRWSF